MSSARELRQRAERFLRLRRLIGDPVAEKAIREVASEICVPVLCNIHDVELACDFCTRVIGLQDGVKKFEGARDTLDKAALNDIYAMEVL